MDFNLAVMLAESARRAPAKPAVILGASRLSYAELDDRSDRMAANLVAAGVNPGDRIGLHLPNIPEFVIAYFAILKAGAVVVPFNGLLRAVEIEFQLQNSGCRTLITFVAFLPDALPAARSAQVERLYVVGPTDSGGGPASPPSAAPPAQQSDELSAGSPVVQPFDDLLAGDPPGPQLARRNPVDPAVIIYTSGTTGTPKGAVLSHITLYVNADIPGRLFEFSDEDIVVVALPLFHVFALSSVMNVCILLGGTMSLVPRFDAAAVLDLIERDRATVFEGVPTMFHALLAAATSAPHDLSSLRVAISGGAPIPAEVLDTFERRFGVTVLEGYGLSETASTTTFNVSAEDRRIYSVGRPIWGVQVEVWDERGQPLPAGADHVGEIVVRGPNVMTGYHENPAATAEAFAGGWFHTGDLGYFDADGYLFIVGRIKELIIRGGYNVYPREVEEAIYTHPAVAEAAVVGVPDERLGEEVHAVVALKPEQTITERELIEFLKQRVAAYKYPRTVEFRESLPKGASGKILKKDLRGS